MKSFLLIGNLHLMICLKNFHFSFIVFLNVTSIDLVHKILIQKILHKLFTLTYCFITTSEKIPSKFIIILPLIFFPFKFHETLKYKIKFHKITFCFINGLFIQISIKGISNRLHYFFLFN